MENELIQVFFDLATENIDWEKRKLRNTQQISKAHKVHKQEHSIKHVATQNKSSVRSEMTEDFLKFITDINIRIDDYRQSGEKELLKQLEEDYRILCVNFEHFGRPQVMAKCIKNASTVLHGNRKKLNKIKKQDKQKSIEMTDRGIQIQKRLSEIKSLIKKDLSQYELHKINNELIIYKNELTDNLSVFSKADNISIKLFQIENYLCKLSQMIIVNSNLSKKEEVIIQETNYNAQNGQTQRGTEIQAELARLRDEVKKKDLNPIEKENLINALLKLQYEINSEVDKFSKFDSIPIRLSQIENYLEKLKGKEKIKQESVKTNNEVLKKNKPEISKKQKMQIIWKVSL